MMIKKHKVMMGTETGLNGSAMFGIGASWINDERETQSYNTNNDWVEWILYNWNGSTWINDIKDNAIYDGNNNLVEWELRIGMVLSG